MSRTAPARLTDDLDRYGEAAIRRELRNRSLRRILACAHTDLSNLRTPPLGTCRDCRTRIMFWPPQRSLYHPAPGAEPVSTPEFWFRFDEMLRAQHPGRYRWLTGPSQRERTLRRLGLAEHVGS